MTADITFQSRGNILLDAAGIGELSGKTARLTGGQVVPVSGDLVWFPTTSVVRSEVGEPRVLGGWIDRTGAVGLIEALQGYEDSMAWIVEVTGQAVVVEKQAVMDLLERSPRFSRAVMDWLSQTARDTHKRAAYNVRANASDSVTRLIFELHRAHGYPDQITMNQAEIARLTGIQRTTVCSVMIRLKDQRVIKYSRSRITILEGTGSALAA